jgi:LmbE family N-acetylglucosaminyl deacetylase
MDFKKIAFIGAHPDDIELAAGGFVSKLVADHKTKNVICIVVTGTCSFDHRGSFIRSSEEAESESLTSLRILGISAPYILGYEDMSLTWSRELISKIDQILQDEEIDTVVTHSVHDTHQDHVAVCQCALSAARRINNFLMFEPITPSGRGPIAFNPQLYIDITGYTDQKINALRSHHSQYRRYGEEWISGVLSRCSYRGYEIGKQYAESFEVVRLAL